MEISIADFMIHVEEDLPVDRLYVLEEQLRDDPCVVSARVSSRNSHLMMVAYNPMCTTASRIVSHVEGEGIHARAVGL